MRKNSGGAAEEAAVLFLEGKGIRILERNFRSYHGEIDIIALEQEMILVVEVKMRSYGDCGTAAEAVDSGSKRESAIHLIIIECRGDLQRIRRFVLT